MSGGGQEETTLGRFIPLARYIDIDDSEQVLRAIHRAEKDVPIDIILHTPDGLALAATLIAMALEAHPAKKTVTGPHYAMSGETLIAFASVPLVRRKMHPFLFSNRSQAARGSRHITVILRL